MVLILQYTLSDLRSLSKYKKSLLSKPSWLGPNVYQDFIRCSGPIIERRQGGVNNWIGEKYVCKISRGLLFPDQLILNNVKFTNVSKHQFSNGLMTKFEFVFVSKNSVEITKNLPYYLDYAFENTEVNIRSTLLSRVRKSIKLKDLGKNLIDYHFLNSTFTKDLKKTKQKDFIFQCIPQVYLEVEKRDRLILISAQKKLEDLPNPFKVSGNWIRINNKPLRVWINNIENNLSKEQLKHKREMRISLLRYYSEYQCLTKVLDQITTGNIKITPRSVSSDLLQNYLNNTTNTILNEEKKLTVIDTHADTLFKVKDLFFNITPIEIDKIKNYIENLKSKLIALNLRPNIENKTTLNIDTLTFQHTLIMENIIKDSQIGIVGDNGKIENLSFTQNNNHALPSNLNYNDLENELKNLRKELHNNASEPEHYSALANISVAEKEAEKQNGDGVVKALLASGKWALDFATKIGASLVVEMIKSNMK